MQGDETWEAVDAARRRLGLGQTATLAEIQEAYRACVRELHPDRCPPDRQEWCHQQMTDLNRAYETLRDYCAGYRYSFAAEDVRREMERRDPRAHWLARFGSDPV